jgi:hypothetical protein
MCYNIKRKHIKLIYGEQMRFLLPMLLACSSDIAIITPAEKMTDTEEVIADQDTQSEQPTPEPSNEPSTEMSNLTVGLAKMHFKQIACPACVGAPGEFDIRAELLLHYPTSGNYFEYLTPLGTCTTNLLDTHVGSQPLMASQVATFNDIQLSPISSGKWENSYLYEYQYQRQAPYNIITEHGTINNAFVSIEGFDWIEPYTLLWVDPSYAFEAIISKNGTTFTWSPVIANSMFEIIIAVYSPDGSQLLGAVSCLENDTGFMNIPGSYFQSYPTWSLAAVHLIRHRIGDAPSPELNGWLQSHMIWEVIGTGHIE